MDKNLQKINKKLNQENLSILIEKLEKAREKPIAEIMVDLIIEESKRYGFIEASD